MTLCRTGDRRGRRPDLGGDVLGCDMSLLLGGKAGLWSQRGVGCIERAGAGPWSGFTSLRQPTVTNEMDPEFGPWAVIVVVGRLIPRDH